VYFYFAALYRVDMIQTEAEYKYGRQLLHILTEAISQLEADETCLDAGWRRRIRGQYLDQRSSLIQGLREYEAWSHVARHGLRPTA
jgi:hypothetical protein